MKGVENELEEVKDAFGASKLCIGGENARRGLTTSDAGQKWMGGVRNRCMVSKMCLGCGRTVDSGRGRVRTHRRVANGRQ